METAKRHGDDDVEGPAVVWLVGGRAVPAVKASGGCLILLLIILGFLAIIVVAIIAVSWSR